MNKYIIVGTFKPNTKMREVYAVYKEELAQVNVLRSAGQLGTVQVSMASDKVFLEINAPDEKQALEVATSLPMSRWWNLDAYPTFEPTVAGAEWQQNIR